MNVLVFHIGSLGDTLVAVPALKALRDHYPSACISLLTNIDSTSRETATREILTETGWIDRWMEYPTFTFSKHAVFCLKKIVHLHQKIRQSRYDILIYLVRQRSRRAIRRDYLFFRTAGIRKFWHNEMPPRLPEEHPGYPLPVVEHQVDRFLDILRKHGIDTPEPGKARLDVRLTDIERTQALTYLDQIRLNKDTTWIAVGPGASIPAKRWPVERYAQVVRRLILKYDVHPIVFGGREDRIAGEKLINFWQRGHNAAGALGVRIGIAVLEHCALYLGNDTGTMHMAVSAGIPCVAVFSARDYPGLWHPYGANHVVLRRRLPCEGCMLPECNREEHPCLSCIDVDEVFSAVCAVLDRMNDFDTPRSGRNAEYIPSEKSI